MRTQRPTSWLLDGRLGWRTAVGRDVAVGASIRLAGDPQGPLALASADGSLGGVVLPRGMALDDRGRLYLLSLSRPRPQSWFNRRQTDVWIKRLDPQTRKFTILPTVGDRVGSDARQLRRPANIAIAGRNLYVADYGNRRVQVFDTVTLTLRHLWPSPDEQRNWRPIDVAARADAAYILDARYGRVYRHRVGDDSLSLVVEPQEARGRWTRIAVDRKGSIYLLDQPKRNAGPAQEPRLVVFDYQGDFVEEKTDSNEIRDRFDAPPIRLFNQDGKELFCLPESLTGLCGGGAPSAPPPPETPLALCAGGTTGGLIFDRGGAAAVVNWEAPAGPRLYKTEGKWISKELDSGIPRCQWHRIELEIGDLPPGARLEVSSYAGDGLRDPEGIPDGQWELSFAVTGQSQPPDRALSLGRQESLIQSREGQYLWVRIKLAGDGYGSPSVNSIRAHFPRETYLAYLPAIYSADEESRRFLERFLSIFQTEWDELERRIADVAAYFDPKAVPAGDFLNYLASWLALPIEGGWNDEQKRRLLVAAPNLFRRRGLVEGLRGYLRIYLQNITGLGPEEQMGFPQIIEGFRERQRFTLLDEESSELGRSLPLWSRSVVGRLQLGVFSREGEARLVSTGDPQRDQFHEFAHRFRVFIPSAWAPREEDLRTLRRAIDLEKPGHASYDLYLVEPQFRVGVQSMVGVDTVVGAHSAMSLAKHDDEPVDRPKQMLGVNTILGRHPKDETTLRLAPGARVGEDTVLN
jgi:phage tail-like protein